MGRAREEFGSVNADDAYDGAPIYGTVPPALGHSSCHPASFDCSSQSRCRPQSFAARPEHYRDGNERITGLAKGSRLRPALACQDGDGYSQSIGSSLLARGLPGRRAEASVGIVVLNRMLQAGRASYVRSLSMVS